MGVPTVTPPESTKFPVSLPSLPYEAGYCVFTVLIEEGHDALRSFPHVRATFVAIVSKTCSQGQITRAFMHAIDPVTTENVEGGHNEHGALPWDALNFPISQAEHDCVLEPPNPALQEQSASALKGGQIEHALYAFNS